VPFLQVTCRGDWTRKVLRPPPSGTAAAGEISCPPIASPIRSWSRRGCLSAAATGYGSAMDCGRAIRRAREVSDRSRL